MQDTEVCRPAIVYWETAGASALKGPISRHWPSNAVPCSAEEVPRCSPLYGRLPWSAFSISVQRRMSALSDLVPSIANVSLSRGTRENTRGQ